MHKKVEREKSVLILIEHVARELESAVLMKYFFEKKSYKVIIDSIKFHKEKVVLKYNPDIIIVPWAYTNKEVDLFRSFRKKNKKVIILNMHHEQISNDGSDSFIIPQQDAKEILHLSWGNNFTDKLLMNRCSSDTILTCGNPRLDFYKKDLIRISDTKFNIAKKYNLDENKKWVLFIANSFHLWTEEQIRVNLDKGVDIEEQLICSINNRKDFLKYIDKYLTENDDVEVIYRPHPSFAHIEENLEEINNISKKHQNFKCISKHSIRDWILNCDLSISFHSTSVIESCVANKEFYLMRSYELSKDKDYRFFNNYEYVIRNYDDLYNAIKSKNKFDYTNFIKEMEEYISLNLNEYSSEKLVEYIDCMYKDIENYYTKIDFKITSHIKNYGYCLIKNLIFIFGKISSVKKYLLNKNDLRLFNLFYQGDDYFTQEDINKIQYYIESALKNSCKGECYE